MRAAIASLVLLAGLGAAQGSGSVALRWEPAQPMPSFVLDVPLGVTYTAQPPASLQAARVELGVRSEDVALNVTVAPGSLDLAPPPTGGSASGNATVHLRWLFAPARNATQAVVDITASWQGSAAPASTTKAQMVVLYPPPAPGPAPRAPPAAAATPLPAHLALAALGLAALGLAALRRVQGRAQDARAWPCCPRSSPRSPRR